MNILEYQKNKTMKNIKIHKLSQFAHFFRCPGKNALFVAQTPAHLGWPGRFDHLDQLGLALFLFALDKLGAHRGQDLREGCVTFHLPKRQFRPFSSFKKSCAKIVMCFFFKLLGEVSMFSDAALARS